jgi:hypothetical protein
MYTKRFLGGACVAVVAAAALVAAAAPGTARTASAALPSGNTVEQWNQIAENTVVGSGAFQNEGYLYMAYESTAVYDAVVSIEGGHQPLEPTFRAWKKASPDAAVVEAAYRTLRHYFPAAYASLDPLYAEALSAIPDGPAKQAGVKIGVVAANQVIRARSTDALTQPIALTSSFPLLAPGPGVWRLTPPFAAAQTPWVGNVRPFILRSAAQFLPAPPPLLSSPEWVTAFNEVKTYGAAKSSVRTLEQTNVAQFETANVIRQYNGVVRDIANARQLDLAQTARLAAMVNVIAADAGISVMHAKYHYLFWRPVTAIDPTAVTADGYGPSTGYDDGNAATAEQTGWRPLLATPNHPEYPAAHGSLTGAMADVFSAFLGTDNINLDIHGFDPNGPAGNLNAVQHFNTADDLRTEIVNARVWGGIHYRFSTVAGVLLGQKVADYDLKHAFQSVG